MLMMYGNIFPCLLDTARAWVYPTNAPISAARQQQLVARLRAFARGWRSHGRSTVADFAVLENRFVVAGGALRSDGELSGCSIDSLTRAISEAAGSLDIMFLSPLYVFYVGTDGAVHANTRGAFRHLVASGAVGHDTTVFDPGITAVGSLRQGAFALPFGDSWHARVFRRRAAALA